MSAAVSSTVILRIGCKNEVRVYGFCPRSYPNSLNINLIRNTSSRRGVRSADSGANHRIRSDNQDRPPSRNNQFQSSVKIHFGKLCRGLNSRRGPGDSSTLSAKQRKRDRPSASPQRLRYHNEERDGLLDHRERS